MKVDCWGWAHLMKMDLVILFSGQNSGCSHSSGLDSQS